MEQILDPLQYQMLQYLPVSEFVNLCRTSKTFGQFCDNPDTWRYFIGRDFKINYRGENPKKFYFQREAEDLYVLSRLNRIRMIADEESFWMLMDLMGYKLEQKVPDMKFIEESVDDMATYRLFGILCSLSEDTIRTMIIIYIDLMDRLHHISVYPFFEISDWVRYIFPHGKHFYDQMLQNPKLLESIEINSNQGIYTIMYRVKNQLEKEVCDRIMKMESDDPVLRNL